MKKLFVLVLVLTTVVLADTSAPTMQFGQLIAPETELAQLQAQIASMKAAGQSVDPALSTRARELTNQLNGNPVTTEEVLNAVANDGFGTPTVFRPQELTPLEQQIKELEFQLDGGFSSVEPDEITRLNLKDQLNDLYAQRDVRDPGNPLDQGADACPATVISGLPYTDSGTTAARANNYSPAQVGGSCYNTNAPDVIYSFVPPYTLSYTITTNGSNVDTYLYIQTGGACPGTTTVECDDDDGIGTQSLITRVLNAGTTYYIIVETYSGNGNYVLNVFDNCNVDCQPGDIQECFETRDNTHARLDCDGGCANETWGGAASWQNIQPCQAVCGGYFTFIGPDGGNYRDMDAYRVTLSEACSLAVTVDSEVGYHVFVLSGSCPWSFVWGSAPYVYPCSTATIISPCLPAGTYSVVIAPYVFTGINDFRAYRARMDLIPCSGCRIDAAFSAPASVAWNTCGAGNNNSLRPSEDYTYCVNIPYESDWTFSTCNDDSIWDSYIYLSTQCNGGVIAQNDDECGGIGLSVIRCVHLTAGTYYLTVEGYNGGCGPFVLNVSECLGRCCYGEIYDNPQCELTNLFNCGVLGGVFTEGVFCDTPCPTRPSCQDRSIFGQQPFMPVEYGTALASQVDIGAIQSDNYAASEAVSSVRFWGFPLICNGAPESFQVEFSDGMNSCLYTVTTTGVQLPEVYFGTYNLSQYDVAISPPCGIPSGNLSVAKVGDMDCQWFWATSPFGDGSSSASPFDFAFCLGAPCPAIDSLTIQLVSPDLYELRWYQAEQGFVDLWTADDPSDEWPGGFTFYGSLYAPAGQNSGTYFSSIPFNYARLILNCAPPPAAVNVSSPLEFRKQEETK